MTADGGVGKVPEGTTVSPLARISPHPFPCRYGRASACPSGEC